MNRSIRRIRQWAWGARSFLWHTTWRRIHSRISAPDAILAPGVEIFREGLIFIDRKWSPAGVTAQFTSDAETYHRRYFERLDFIDLIDRCLRLADIDREREMRVLDIGSGGGSSVLAACRLLPRSEIIASDISPQLLGMLAAFVESRDDLRGRIKSFCFDVHRRFFRPESFDLVIGAAILHHLLDPRAALINVASSLKRGGKIILVEPLESGSLVLTAMYAGVLRVLGELGQADGELARLMRALRLDIQCRTGPPAAKPWTAALDDKWVFDEPYLMELAAELGLSKVAVHPAQPDLTHIFEGAFRSVLADSGNAGLEIPEPVLECVREFDRDIGPGLKERLCPTGIIVFTG
jgi:SAM-dependent methyltransferase